MLRSIWGIVSAATLMGMSGAALAHNGAITLDGNVSVPLTVTTSTANSHANSHDSHVSGSQQLEGVVDAPLALASGAAGTSAMVGTAGSSLELSQQTYAVASGASVMFHKMAYDGAALYPGERVHAALQSGMVSTIDLQSAAAWETYESSTSGSVTLSFDGGTQFTAPLAANAMIREPGGRAAATSIPWKAGTLIRVVWNAQGQIVMMGARGMGTAPPHHGPPTTHSPSKGQNNQGGNTQGGNNPSGPIANPLGSTPGDAGHNGETGHGHGHGH